MFFSKRAGLVHLMISVTRNGTEVRRRSNVVYQFKRAIAIQDGRRRSNQIKNESSTSEALFSSFVWLVEARVDAYLVVSGDGRCR